MPIGYLIPLIDGEVKTLDEFFWKYVAMNRRDSSYTDPIICYTWNEEHEKGRIQKASDELISMETKTEDKWQEEFSAFLAETTKRHTKMNAEDSTTKKVVSNMLTQVQQQTTDGPLSAWYHTLSKMLTEEQEYTERHLSYREEGDDTSLDTYKRDSIKSAKWDIDNITSKYTMRKDKCKKHKEFITAALEAHGEPPNGIEYISSEDMW